MNAKSGFRREDAQVQLMCNELVDFRGGNNESVNSQLRRPAAAAQLVCGG